MLKEIIKNNRSYRRFYQNERIENSVLRELVELVRYTPSTVNSQALKFMLISDEKECEKVFPTLAWAGLLKNWNGPEEGERPSAYIIILCDKAIAVQKPIDDGIAAQTIMLGAAEKGLGGCILGAVNREKLSENLEINSGRYSIDLVLALGKPKETVKIVDVGSDGSTVYYRDENGVHYVPKRTVDELIVR